MKTLKDYKIGQLVYATWFGDVKKMRLIGFDEPTNQMQVKHLDAQGSFYQTPAEEQEARQIYKSIRKNKWQQST